MNTTDQEIETPKTSRLQEAMKSRLVRSFVVGLVITLVSWIIVGFNLSTGGSIKINDDINRYFDSCVLETFVDSTPRIRTESRGFPLAYFQESQIPVCNNPGQESRRTSSTVIDWGALGANLLFWTCLVFVISRKYTLRRALKIHRSA